MSYKNIIFEHSDKIGLLTLNRPDKRNALSVEMREEITKCLSEIESNNEIEVLIITGAGKGFCGGFDLNEFASQDKEFKKKLFETSAVYHRKLAHFPKPTIAAINGPAMGGGFDLTVLCDIRVASENAVFAHPEIKFGGPPLFTPLRFIVGEGIARELCLTGRKMDAKEAYARGLINHIFNSGELISKSKEIARQIIESPTHAIQATKGFFIKNSGKGFDESFVAEHDDVFEKFFLL